jgi:3-phenylpropionate/cinnamic acid dioxygenase small subunit
VGLFYAYEAELLDEWRLDEWLDLVDEGFTYLVPVPLVTDQHPQLGYDPSALFMDETRDSIAENWVARLTDENIAVSWADRPPVRTRRFLSALRVRSTDEPEEYLARMNVQVSMARHGTQPGEMIGERFDIVRRAGDSFCIMSRFVVLLSAVVDAPRPRTIL